MELKRAGAAIVKLVLCQYAKLENERLEPQSERLSIHMGLLELTLQ